MQTLAPAQFPLPQLAIAYPGTACYIPQAFGDTTSTLPPQGQALGKDSL